MVDILKPKKQTATAPILASQEFIPTSLFAKTRDYLTKVAWQINGCYSRDYYDACAAMMRRLIETLIIEIYETAGRVNEIKSQGEIIGLDVLINKIFSDKTLHISRDVRNTLEKIKNLGDTGAHNRKVNLIKPTIDGIKERFTIAVQELLQNAKFR